jgi:hypothetical protein
MRDFPSNRCALFTRAVILHLGTLFISIPMPPLLVAGSNRIAALGSAKRLERPEILGVVVAQHVTLSGDH